MASLYVSKTYEEAERWGDYFAKIGIHLFYIKRKAGNKRFGSRLVPQKVVGTEGGVSGMYDRIS